MDTPVQDEIRQEPGNTPTTAANIDEDLFAMPSMYDLKDAIIDTTWQPPSSLGTEQEDEMSENVMDQHVSSETMEERLSIQATIKGQTDGLA